MSGGMVFRWDACGVVCVLMVYAAVAYADYVVIYWLVLPTFDQSLWGVLHVCLFNMCIFVMCLAHTRAMTSDPGIVPRSAAQLDFGVEVGIPQRNGRRSQLQQSDSDSDAATRPQHVGDQWTICGRCEAYRPPRAHHCRVCKRCIRKMDHHCPWINNCVGEYNQKYFLQFLFYVAVVSVYAGSLIVVAWAQPCADRPMCNRHEPMHHSRVLHSIFLSIEAILFCLFVMAVSCDQVSAILNDETAVEQVQRRGPHRQQRTKRQLFKEVCGPGPILLWLLPCHNLPQSRDIVRLPHRVV